MTFIAPYAIALPGNITVWKVQFHGFQLSSGGITDPMGVQIKVLRKTSNTTLTVVAAGPVHDPRPILRARLPGYPFVLTESEVIEFTDPGLSVLPGDLVGITYTVDPSAGFFAFPFASTTPLPARLVVSDVPVGGVRRGAQSSIPIVEVADLVGCSIAVTACDCSVYLGLSSRIIFNRVPHIRVVS